MTVPRAPPVEFYLQDHALRSMTLVPALVQHLAPIDEAKAKTLFAELTASSQHGELAQRAKVGFADAGARSGYVLQHFASRARRLGCGMLLDPSTCHLLQSSRQVRVVSFGGGPGECVLALALCRSV